MRITVISSRFPPMRGGVSDYTKLWCSAMGDVGHEVTVITSTGAAAVPGMTVDNSQVHWGRQGFSALAEAAESSRPDVLVLQYVPHAYSRRGGGLPFALRMRRLVRKVGVPLVVHGHELYGAWGASPRRAPWFAAQRIGIAVLAEASSRVVVTVKAREERLNRFLPMFRERITSIPIGPTIAPVDPEAGWRKAHGVDKDKIVLVTLGLGHESQDAALIAGMLDRLNKEGLPVRLFVVGGMSIEHPSAKELGFLNPHDAASALSAADLFVLPLTDGVSGRRSAIISALAAGAPILSTCGVDTDPSLFSTDALRLTPTGDGAAFQDAAVDLVRNSQAREALRLRGRELFEREFSWPTIAARWDVQLHIAINSADPSGNKDTLANRRGSR